MKLCDGDAFGSLEGSIACLALLAVAQDAPQTHECRDRRSN